VNSSNNNNNLNELINNNDINNLNNPNNNSNLAKNNNNYNNTNNSNNLNRNMLSQFVGGINNMSPSHASNSSSNENRYVSNYNNMMANQRGDDPISNQSYYESGNNTNNQSIKLIKRRSITSSPIRSFQNIKSYQMMNMDKLKLNDNNIDMNKKSSSPSSYRKNTSQMDQENFVENQALNKLSQKQKKINHNHSSSKAFRNKSIHLNSEETTSTDSDIGTSPSGTTLASSPSSPQQQAMINLNSNNIEFSDSSFTKRMNKRNNEYYEPDHLARMTSSSPTTNNTPVGYQNLNNSVVRQHSYLNAVQLNDYKAFLKQQEQSRNAFTSINESGDALNTFNENNYHQQPVTSFDYINNENSTPSSNSQTAYFYSPSALIDRQRQLKIQQQKLIKQNNSNNQISSSIVKFTTPNPASKTNSRSSTKSSHLMNDININKNNQNRVFFPESNNNEDETNFYKYKQQNFNINNDSYDSSNRQNRMKSANQSQQQQKNMFKMQNRSQTIEAPHQKDYEIRRDSLRNQEIQSQNKEIDQQNFKKSSPINNINDQIKSKSSNLLQIQESRNTSIKKLKSFFGEKAPPNVVLKAVENKNVIASDEFLATLLETIKEGVLNCKIVTKDGKRSSDRSWRPAWAVLKKSGALFLCKEKKDNIMIPSVDSYPINLKNSSIDIAYDYTKRKNVFKLITFSNSEYLFQTIDNDSMLDWIRAMQENSTPPDLEKLLAEHNELNKMKQKQQQNNSSILLNMKNLNNNNSNNNSWIYPENNSNDSINDDSYSNINNNDTMKSLKKKKNSSVKQLNNLQYSINSNSNIYNSNFTNSTELINSSSNDLYQIQNANNNSMSPIHMRKGIFDF
jgi:hypothetical protein